MHQAILSVFLVSNFETEAEQIQKQTLKTVKQDNCF